MKKENDKKELENTKETKISKKDKTISKETKTEVTTKEKKPKKEEKTIPASKLPKLFTKAYTEKQLEKRLYKKIYIKQDKEYLASLIKECGKNKKDIALYSIPKDLMFTKKELAQLKTLAKEIKSQKGRVRWVPLIATVAFIAAVVIVITATKNIIATKAIKSICESTFEAKCDIRDLDISFLNAHFRMDGLEVANKNEPMKNLFSVEGVNFDFDMLQLLRARFVANELSITGVATNTDRKYSGDISAQLRAKYEKKKAKKAEKEAKNADSAFMKSLSEKTDLAMDTLTSSVTGLFDKYNPETIIKDCYAQLQTPTVAKETEEEAKKLIASWTERSKQISTKVTSTVNNAQEITKIDINAVKTDPIKLKETIELLNTTYNDVSVLKKETDTISRDLKSDVSKATSLATNIQTAIQNDTNLVSTEISKITSLNISDGKRFVTQTFDTIAYQVLGKYYPYVQKGVGYLMQAKNSSKDDTAKKAKKVKKTSTITQRAEGRTVFYKIDSTPKIWIKKAAGSGPNFAFDAENITNDMNKTGKPATGTVSLSFKELDHYAKLSVDTRSESKAPLVTANYNCDKLPLNYPTSKFGDAPGVPGIETNSNLDLLFKIYEDDGFDITGRGKFTDMNITTVPFEPAFASDIYSNVMANIKSMDLATTIGYTVSSGLNLNLTSDVDKQFIAALSSELKNQLSVITNKAQTELIAKLNEASGGALGEIKSFDDIKAKVNGYVESVNNIYKQLENKRTEAENALKNAAKSKVDEATNNAKDKAKEAVTSGLKKLF